MWLQGRQRCGHAAVRHVGLREGQRGPCSSKAHDNRAHVAVMGGGDMCGCEGGSNVAVQL